MASRRAGLIVVLALASLAGGLTTRAGAQEAVAPSPRPTTFAAGIIEPLREIGRVKAVTSFCKALGSHSSLGISTALEFEQQLLLTLGKMRDVNFNSELEKHRTLRELERHINHLADLALAGRAELDELKDFDTEQDRHEAVVDFVNALNGAKGQQMQLARTLSRAYGTLAERPVYTIVTLPGDTSNISRDVAGRRSFLESGQSPANFLDDRSYALKLELNRYIFDAMPGDERVGHDLQRAAQFGRRAIALGGC